MRTIPGIRRLSYPQAEPTPSTSSYGQNLTDCILPYAVCDIYADSGAVTHTSCQHSQSNISTVNQVLKAALILAFFHE